MCLLAGLVYGVFTALALPPVGVWPLALAAIVPLLWVGCRSGPRVWVAALWAGIGTLPLWFLESVWLVNVTRQGYPALALYLSVYPTLFVWMIGVARRTDWPIPMSIVAPIMWTGLEVLKGEVIFDGYAWYLLGHPLIEAPLLAAPASIFGAYFVSFLCAALGGAIADAAGWSGLYRPIGGIGAMAWSMIWAVCAWIGSPPAHEDGTTDARLAVVQTNLPQDNKMGWTVASQLKDFQRFVELTRFAGALQPGPDAVIWPETMFPGRALNADAVRAEKSLGLIYTLDRSPLAPEGRVNASKFHDDLLQVQKELGIPMLVGSIAIDGDYAEYVRRTMEEGKKPREQRRSIEGLVRRYNSAFLIHGGSVREDRYDKMELTPFGEIIPYLWRWPRGQQMVLNLGAAGMRFDLAMGGRARGIDIPLVGQGRMKTVRAATPICFEATKADLCRRLILGDGTGRAAMFINLSNDGWFSFWDPGRQQHMQAARWRCVEMGVPMVRAVNTGISSAIDRHGRVKNDRLIDRPEGTIRSDGVLVAQVRVEDDRPATIFERVGMLPAYGVFALSVIGTGVLWLRRRRVASGHA